MSSSEWKLKILFVTLQNSINNSQMDVFINT